jgi:hypothetical protein
MAGRGPWLTVVLIVAYVGAWAASPLLVSRMPSDLDIFFWPSAEVAAHGHPLLVYSAQGRAAYPNANGPLGLVPLVPIAMIANSLGLENNLQARAGMAGVVIAVVALLAGRESLRLIRAVCGDVRWRFGAMCVVLVAPVLWISSLEYGHVEQPIELGLVLLAVRYAATRRSVAAGVALGLAVLARTTALLYILPFMLLPIATRRWKATAALLAAGGCTVAAGLTPFLVADRANVVHSLVTYRGGLPIGGGSLWVAIRGSAAAGLVQHADTYLILGAAAALVGAAVWFRPAATTTTAGVCGLLTITAACFPMLAKTVFPYYMLEPCVLAAVWWLARPGSAWNWRIAAPVVASAGAFVAEWGRSLPVPGLGVVEGVASSLAMATVIALVMVDLAVMKPGLPPCVTATADPSVPRRCASTDD